MELSESVRAAFSVDVTLSRLSGYNSAHFGTYLPFGNERLLRRVCYHSTKPRQSPAAQQDPDHHVNQALIISSYPSLCSVFSSKMCAARSLLMSNRTRETDYYVQKAGSNTGWWINAD
jgi:hypothetical protein